MVRKTILATALLSCGVFLAWSQQRTFPTAGELLTELGSMVAEIPPTLEGCQMKLTEIREWQQASLRAVSEAKSLRITKPLDGSDAPHRLTVVGRIVDSDAKVWVVVHPTGVSDYWVQPAATVKEDGTWKVSIYVGRPGKDSGKHFELMAVANPEQTLSNGQVLSGWPEAPWRSQVVEIVRE